MTTLNSHEVYEALCRLIPGGVNSPVRALKEANRDPLILESAKEDLLTDIEGNQYIDFCASWGALILGHADKGQTDCLTHALQKGTSYGVTSVLEKECAEKVIGMMPTLEKLRFVSSGTEATMYALRLARGATGKEYIVKYVGNYHGCADFLLTQAGSGFATHTASTRGIPDAVVQYTLNLPYNDLDALEQLFSLPQYKDNIAAVIIEPVAANMGCVPANPNYLKRLREITQQNQTLLIFDEVVTGFRVAKAGVFDHYQIKPDLTCLGKIIGGGLPAAAYGGRADLMDLLSPNGPIYQAGTLSGNPFAMAAGSYVLNQLETPGFYEGLEAKTQRFLKPIEEALQNKNGCVQKVGSMFTLFFGVKKVQNMKDSQASNKSLFWKFFNTLLEEGIYWPPSPYESCFMMRAHSDEHLQRAQEIILNFIDLI